MAVSESSERCCTYNLSVRTLSLLFDLDTVLNYFTEMIAVCPNELDVKPSDQCVPREFLLSKRYGELFA